MCVWPGGSESKCEYVYVVVGSSRVRWLWLHEFRVVVELWDRLCVCIASNRWPLLSDRRMLPSEMSVVGDYCFWVAERYCAKCLGSRWPLLSDRRLLPCEMTVVGDHCFRVAKRYHVSRQDVADILRIWGLLGTIALGRSDPKPTGAALVNVTCKVELGRVESHDILILTCLDDEVMKICLLVL